jgi:uncharacterized protein YceK
MKRLACLALLVLALAGCDTVASTPGGGAGTPARNGSMSDTERDAENLTNWCLNNGLCSAPSAVPFETTTTAKGNSW